jgi:hypothetical protein
LEEDDPGGQWIPKLGQWDIECCLEQQDDGFLEIMHVFRLYCLFVLGFCFHLFLYFFCNTLRVMGFSPSGWCFASERRGVGNLSWPLRG